MDIIYDLLVKQILLWLWFKNKELRVLLMLVSDSLMVSGAYTGEASFSIFTTGDNSAVGRGSCLQSHFFSSALFLLFHSVRGVALKIFCLHAILSPSLSFPQAESSPRHHLPPIQKWTENKQLQDLVLLLLYDFLSFVTPSAMFVFLLTLLLPVLPSI